MAKMVVVKITIMVVLIRPMPIVMVMKWEIMVNNIFGICSDDCDDNCDRCSDDGDNNYAGVDS
jgi:hypothetical protein